jgi:Ser/Thr protein kinase RdoA (MazF antagonist)
MVQHLDPLDTTPPAFPPAAASGILRAAFGIDGSLAPLAGERDQNFRVDVRGGQHFLFKISNPADGPSIVDMQTAALRHIEQVDPGLPVMRALPAADGAPWAEVPGPDGGVYLARLFSFLPGRVHPAADLSTAAIRSFGQTTARLGRALRGFFHPAADYEILWDLTHALKLPRCSRTLPTARAGPRWPGCWTGSRPGSPRCCPGCAPRSSTPT